jgi:uncharacterized protein YbjT (DUF2867 family)
MKALIAGATGLVGSHLLQLLIKDPDYEKIWVLTRRPLKIQDEKIGEILSDFNDLTATLQEVKTDHVFCCLGTTMKKAGSKEAFRKVDFEFPLEIARILRSKGASKFLLVSAIGASRNSMFFYNRVKGKVEEAVRQVNYPALFIFRPSLLLGDRGEERVGEDVAKKIYQYIDWLFIGPFKKYKGIEAATVAAAMWKKAKTDQSGTVILESDKIKEA